MAKLYKYILTVESNQVCFCFLFSQISFMVCLKLDRTEINAETKSVPPFLNCGLVQLINLGQTVIKSTNQNSAQEKITDE